MIWSAFDTGRLSDKARELINDGDNVLHFSAMSLWEIAIKTARNSEDFSVDPKRLHYLLTVNGFVEVIMTSEHGIVAGQLPLLHRDPFDRALIAQARCEDLTLLTADSAISLYEGPILKV
ncbi:type II toxin-antitoxin system VapC family toxin [Brevundimonas vesicularis]|uniref:type II toxin-antitoxin system VapC family toxin n=1 Tax=Brevundimonas vesicularis TaxID=41276 RepID=UPI001F0C68E3|nr:type II toxin-antitoxin system VapC family toxin [Brevundimonas vesicularis]